MKQTLSQRLAYLIATALGWKIELQFPLPSKAVVVGAHHTSSTDLYLALLLMAASGLKFHWVAKDNLFWGPLGWIIRKLGGLPVNRRQRTHFVSQMAALLRERDELLLGILPEGTRRHTESWKTGFYYIALEAEAPIVLGFADYRRKIVGLGPILRPTGELQKDFEFIRQFYTGITGRYPRRQGELKIRSS